jgi:hypothetical protein
MAGEINLEPEISKEKKIHVKNKWLSYVFGSEPLKLEKYEVDPVSDIPIRLAVEKGVIPRKRDLALYRTAEDWNGHPRHSIVIAGRWKKVSPSLSGSATTVTRRLKAAFSPSSRKPSRNLPFRFLGSVR